MSYTTDVGDATGRVTEGWTTALVDDDEAWGTRTYALAGTAMIDDRIIRDSSGLEWEVIDESAETDIGRALECDYPPQERDPGLLFVSREGKRRVYPCPTDWRHLSDDALEGLCSQAPSLA